MKWSLFALCIGFCIDLLIGDPHGLPHPVAAIGHLISLLERLFRRRNRLLFQRDQMYRTIRSGLRVQYYGSFLPDWQEVTIIF